MHWLLPWSFSTVNQAGSRCKCFEMRKDRGISQGHGTVQPLLVHTTHFTFAVVWMIKHQLQVVSFGNLVKLTWWLIQSTIIEARLNEYLPNQYFSTSEVITFVICLLPIFSGRIYIIINAQLGIWHKLWLTPCLMLVKKSHQFFFCFVVFFFS